MTEQNDRLLTQDERGEVVNRKCPNSKRLDLVLLDSWLEAQDAKTAIMVAEEMVAELEGQREACRHITQIALSGDTRVMARGKINFINFFIKYIKDKYLK